MPAPPPENPLSVPAAGRRVIQVSDRCARLVCPETLEEESGSPVVSPSSRLPWRLRLRIWRLNAEFRLLWVRRWHTRLVDSRLRLRLQWLRLRHRRRMPDVRIATTPTTTATGPATGRPVT